MESRRERIAEAHQLSQLLVDAAAQSKAGFTAIAGELGLPVALARAVLQLEDPMPMRALADLLSCDRSYVTALADQLEEHGLATRESGADRRIKQLQLTPAGQSIRSRLTRAVERSSPVMLRLSPDDRAALIPLLEKLVGNAHPGVDDAAC
ncbi:MarR family winged helix-turn-helix transcriptional regulator [Demequina silvatica]|uniref:MarR family winged helix-turn-helix transcriptional regulator n=1 Tax=Demequina silvatica TaxID=1638988 RepID=UPI000782802F|nr:MarR family transcriptional regulator [Demequina silvatica]